MICQKEVCAALFHFCTQNYMLTLFPAFYMVGDIDAARTKGEKILADLEKE